MRAGLLPNPEAIRAVYPDDTWDWAKLVEVGKQLTIDSDANGTPDQWALHRDERHGELLVLARLAERWGM